MLDFKYSDFAVIFDLDGTIVDNTIFHRKAWIELGRRHNLPLGEDFWRNKINGGYFIDIVRDHLAPLIGLNRAMALAHEKEEIYRQLYTNNIKEVTGLMPFLKQLHAGGIPCAVASNSPTLNVNLVLDELKLRQYFKSIIDVAQVSKGKPDPELLLTAASKLFMPAARCIVFEDSVSGFEAARRAGMPYIVIATNQNDCKSAVNAMAVHKDFTTITLDQLRTYVAVHLNKDLSNKSKKLILANPECK